METAPGTDAIPGSAVPSIQAPAAPLPEPTEMMQPLEPVAFVSSSPAVGALVSAADQNSQSGNLDSAVAAIERAIRIEPRNAALFYKLAELRLKQSKPRLAEDLAKKSALLASGNARLKRQSWLLIGNAKVMQQDFAGARAARAKAASF
ncbi:tetratricopeptide repeat protein [Methylobacter sp. sgz302048]|uniref:tetratricopeptide repeat protein n=1 Tax=Methylobacter sp. sgz302048 TaxID=3455945 RepID=UPI003FA0959E